MLRIHVNDTNDTHGLQVEVLKIAEWCAAGEGLHNLHMRSSLLFAGVW